MREVIFRSESEDFGVSLRMVGLGDLQDLGDEKLHGFVDVDVVLGGGLEPPDVVVLVGVLVELFSADLEAWQIALVPEEEGRDGVSVGERDLAVEVLPPLFDGLKRDGPRQIKDDHRGDGVLVVDARHAAISLVACHVPKLQRYSLVVVPVHGLDGKINPNRQLVLGIENAFCIPFDDTENETKSKRDRSE